MVVGADRVEVLGEPEPLAQCGDRDPVDVVRRLDAVERAQRPQTHLLPGGVALGE